MMTGAGTVTQNDSVNLGGGVILINLGQEAFTIERGEVVSQLAADAGELPACVDRATADRKRTDGRRR